MKNEILGATITDNHSLENGKIFDVKEICKVIYIGVYFASKKKYYEYPRAFFTGEIATKDPIILTESIFSNMCAKEAEENRQKCVWKKLISMSRISPRDMHIRNRSYITYCKIDDYVPRGKRTTAEDEEISQRILQYKYGRSYGISYYNPRLLDSVLDIVKCIDIDNITLVAMPRSKRNGPKITALSIRYILNKIKENPELVSSDVIIKDGSMLLTRATDVDESNKASQNRVSYTEHMRTISCTEEVSFESYYILFDDILTSGTQMFACRDILCANGADPNKIIGIVVGRTV